MAENNFNLEEYLAEGAEIIVKDAIKATFRNPKESLFLAKFAKHTRKATAIRESYSKKGQHIPVFLIASITSSCNLHCKALQAVAICIALDAIQERMMHAMTMNL